MSYVSTILEAVKVQLQSIPGLPTVKHRSRPIYWKEDEKQVVILSLIADELDFELFIGSDDVSRACNIKYTVAVDIIAQRNNQYDQTPTDVLDWREAIRQKLYRPLVNGVVTLAGAPTVWNMELGLGQVWESSAFDRAFDVSPLTFIFHSKEPVNG